MANQNHLSIDIFKRTCLILATSCVLSMPFAVSAQTQPKITQAKQSR
jgi:hypothetical protein